MRNTVKYEWGKEITDEHGDIIANDFSDMLTVDFFNSDGELCLVRNEGNEIDGCTDRFWAYVKDGKLPVNFTNELGQEISIKVPVRFHSELAKIV